MVRMLQVKNSISKTVALQSESDQLKRFIKQMEKEYDAVIKILKKKVNTFEIRLQQEFEGKVNEFDTILQQKIDTLVKRSLLMQSITGAAIEKIKEDLESLMIFVQLKHN